MAVNICLLVFSAFFVAVSKSETVQSLDGSWVVKDDSGAYTDLKATVPGGIYSDLIDNNIIEDVFYGYNDNNYKWIARSNWTYSTTFEVEDSLLDNDNVNIVFEGLDTFATITINDVEVGQSQNMFVRYAFNVKDVLKTGTNTVEVKFQSPIEVAAALAEVQDQQYVIPLECPPDEYRGECHANMIRKMQASFSWDWGPAFPSVGIWKTVYLESYSETAIRYVVTDVTEKDDNETWILTVSTYFANNTKQRVTGKISYAINSDTSQYERSYDVDQEPNEYEEIVHTASLEIPKLQVKSWWPNGHGAQSLYNLTVTFTNEGETETSTRSRRVGFRTIELVQDTLDTGLSFYFKVNGVPIFMKGSNEIPINILPERGQDEAVVKYLLESAQDAHMNMLRVWGGGVYESDYFYDKADELGILIWQDFMFACSFYPTNEDYLNNVLEEVRHQVKRISSHASVAIFSGNNENEGALADNWYGTNTNYDTYKNDYITLYVNTIRTEFDRLTGSKGIYVTSSPSNGKETEEEGYVAKYPGNPQYGDVHFYNYVLDPWNSNYYPVPRFCSEYGYQSLPVVESWLTATNDSSDLNVDGNFLDHRQHHPAGNAQNTFLMSLNLELPSESNENYFEAYVYYSQIAQAQAIKVESEHFRRYMSYLDDQGQGYTMGALYWQLNDVWVAPTWSGIDYSGRWKMLQYFARDFFAPVIVTGHLNNERQLQIYAVSDALTTLEDVTVDVQIFKWDSLTPVSSDQSVVTVQSGASVLLQTIDTDNYLSSKDCGGLSDARNNCFFYLSLKKGDLAVSPDNYVFPGLLKESNVQTANVKVSTVKTVDDDSTSFEVTITTDNIAPFVWLDTHDIRGRFSENGFLLVEEQRTVYFTSEEATTIEELQNVLTVTSLKDPKYFS